SSFSTASTANRFAGSSSTARIGSERGIPFMLERPRCSRGAPAARFALTRAKFGAGRRDTGRLEVVSKRRRQALRSCAVGLFLVSKPHARRSGKAGTPFLRPLLALSSV